MFASVPLQAKNYVWSGKGSKNIKDFSPIACDSVQLCSYHILMSPVIYNLTDTKQNGIYLQSIYLQTMSKYSYCIKIPGIKDQILPSVNLKFI